MFQLFHGRDGLLTLTHGDRCVPVDPAHLDESIRERGIHVPMGTRVFVDSSFVTKAIESALGDVGHQLIRAEAMKRGLLHFYGLASDPPRRSEGAA